MDTKRANSQAHDKTLAALAIDEDSSTQAAIAKKAPPATKQSARNTESLGLSSTMSGKNASSDVGQQARSFQLENIQQLSGQSMSTSTSDADGAVSLAFLMSLNLNFTPEQLRLLKAHTQEHSAADATPVASALSDGKASDPASIDRPVHDTMTASSTSSKSRSLSSAKSTSVSITASAALAKASPAATASQFTPIVSASSGSLRLDLPPKTKGSVLQAPSTHQVTQSGTAKSNLPISLSESEPGISTNASRTAHPSVPDRVSALVISRSEMLRQQREMIIGSQVYKNRYSHVAGSLVAEFGGSSSSACPKPAGQACCFISSTKRTSDCIRTSRSERYCD